MYPGRARQRIPVSLGAAALLLTALSARGSGLGVSPILLEFDAGSPARALWLSNAGDRVLHGQVRVFRWTQENGEDRLMPTRELVVSPPMLELGAGEQQLLRVIRTAAYPAGEQAYRILVDELPDAAPADRQGLSFVMEFSVPVFVGGGAPPKLDWSLRRDGGQAILSARNSGGSRAQVSEMELRDAQGQPQLQQGGLFGYVLAGQERRWTVALPAGAAIQTVLARINGERIRADLRAHDGAP